VVVLLGPAAEEEEEEAEGSRCIRVRFGWGVKKEINQEKEHEKEEEQLERARG